MSAGRRGLMLSFAFLGLAVWLCSNKRAHAQPIQFQPVPVQPADPQAGRHTIWKQTLSPEQIRALLAKFGQEDGKGDWFEELLRESVQKRNPNADPAEVDATVKKLLANKEFMNQMMDLAQKHKNEMPNNGNGNNNLPKWTPEDRAKLAQTLKKEVPNFDPNRPPIGDPILDPKGDPFKIPEPPPQVDLNKFPPFDPRHPQFDRKLFPFVDPDNTEFDPKTKFPIDPDTKRPFDPRNGKPIDPKNPPKIEPPPPPKWQPAPPNVPLKPQPPNQFDPPNPPKIDPQTGLPVDPDGKRKFDPDNPLGVPNESPEKITKTKAVEAATALWEKNVGPIDETPAVKRAILDLVSDSEAMDALTDGKGNNFFDLLQKGGDDDKFDLFGNAPDGDKSGWEWPKFEFPWDRGRNVDLDIGERRPRERDTPFRDSSRSRSGPSSMDGLGSFDFGGMRVPWLLMLILAAIITAAVLWWKWATIFQPQAGLALVGGPGPWPIDPREINTREDVVKAFEFLSVLICGPAAKTWTHSTIADELTALAATHGETAVKLARLYELARYAPLDEPLTRAELLEARRLVCDLAGMDE